MLDLEKFIGGVHDYLERSLSPIVARIKALEERQPEKGEKGDSGADGKDGIDGKDGDHGDAGPQGERGDKGDAGRDGIDGKDADPAAVAEIVLAKVFASDEFMAKMVELAHAKVMASIPIPKDGMNGVDGKDADEEAIIAKLIAAIPMPKDGENGKDGQNGKDADEELIVTKVLGLIPAPKDGESITVDDVLPMLDEMVSKHVSELPVKHGENGKDGKDADEQAIIEKVLSRIPVPKDGNSITVDDVTPVLEVAVSKWAVDFERRAHDVLQTAVDRLPKPKDGEKGEPGQDGFGIQEFVQRSERSVAAIYKRGDEVIEQLFTFPAVIDRGVYKSGEDYEKGDGVTYAGSFWISQRDTKDAPGNSDAWRLAVKRGRDGKDAKDE